MQLHMQFDDGVEDGEAVQEPIQRPEWACE